MRLKIEAYTENGYETLAEQTISKIDNWERILRKLYDWVWKHCDQTLIIDIFAIMVDENGVHELSQRWATEYMEYYPKREFPFI